MLHKLLLLFTISFQFRFVKNQWQFLIIKSDNTWTLLFCREACKYTNIIYEWETLPTPCLEKNIRYIGPVVATITGQNATDHILCQVRALYFLPEI